MVETRIKSFKTTKIPFIFHAFNLLALFALSAMLLLTVVVRPYQLLILIPIIAIIILYLMFYTNQNVLACNFGISISLIFWIIICENIVTVDNLLGTEITRRLQLSWRLHSYVYTNLKIERKNNFQQCCNDPLSYNLKPGTEYRYTYDCDICNSLYQTIVDETGYLNRQLGLFSSSEKIDLFLAGDSVTQGFGVPSVLEFVNEQIHRKMWNLSIGGYGPRQKINALITYALQKHPSWLIVEFYSGNDIPDSIADEVCDSVNSFLCRGNITEIRRRLLVHPIYGPMLDVSPNIFERFRYYCENNFTLAVTRYIVDNIKSISKDLFTTKKHEDPPLTESSKKLYNFTDISYPAKADFDIHPEKLVEWTLAGMAITHKHYARLITELMKIESRPTVILLYNPSAYEIYRDIFLDRHPKFDRVAEIQSDGQRDFSEKNDWIFLDLTDPLRREFKKNKIWIYGRYDGTHWSREGTGFVAAVLTAELLKVLGPAEPISVGDVITHRKSRLVSSGNAVAKVKAVGKATKTGKGAVHSP
jgi:hypothetical protein